MNQRRIALSLGCAVFGVVIFGLYTNMVPGLRSGSLSVKPIASATSSSHLGASSLACVNPGFPFTYTTTTALIRFKIQDSPVKFRNYLATEYDCLVVSPQIPLCRRHDCVNIGMNVPPPNSFPVTADPSCSVPGVNPFSHGKYAYIVCPKTSSKLSALLNKHSGVRPQFKITHGWQEIIILDEEGDGGTDDGFISGP